MKFELTIRKGTAITLLSDGSPVESVSKEPHEIEIAEIEDYVDDFISKFKFYSGLICFILNTCYKFFFQFLFTELEGNFKSPMQTITYLGSVFGYAAVYDDLYKVEIRIKDFEPTALTLNIGMRLTVIGHVRQEIGKFLSI